MTALPFASVALIAFWTVLAAELVGDKSIYTVASLALRFRTGTIFSGITAAFAAKMLAAVLLSRLIVKLNPQWTDVLSAVAFFASALFIWFKEVEPDVPGRPVGGGEWHAAAACFSALFFTEWGDPGQIAAAALAVKSHAAFATWLGGTLAMMTKGGLAIALGYKLRDRVPHGILRTLASASCCLLGVITLRGLVFR